MNIQRVLIALSAINAAMLIYSLARPRLAEAQNVTPVLRGRAFEIVDEHNRVRASITVFPADPNVKMPDGTTGYPEMVLFRLINSKSRLRRRDRSDLCFDWRNRDQHVLEVD